jgi:hypothetical protein
MVALNKIKMFILFFKDGENGLCLAKEQQFDTDTAWVKHLPNLQSLVTLSS